VQETIQHTSHTSSFSQPLASHVCSQLLSQDVWQDVVQVVLAQSTVQPNSQHGSVMPSLDKVQPYSQDVSQVGVSQLTSQEVVHAPAQFSKADWHDCSQPVVQ